MFSEGKGKKFITLKEASKFSGYTSDHLARLVRNLEIRGKRVGRIWLITREDLEAYLLSQNRDGAHAKRGFINLKDASMLSGYTRDHIARIIRNEEVAGKRVGRIWLVSRDGLENYVEERNNAKKISRVLREDIIRHERANKLKGQVNTFLSDFEKLISSFTNPATDLVSKKIEEFKKKSYSFANLAEEGEKNKSKSEVGTSKENTRIPSWSLLRGGAVLGLASVVVTFLISGMLAYAGYTTSSTREKVMGWTNEFEDYSEKFLQPAVLVYSDFSNRAKNFSENSEIEGRATIILEIAKIEDSVSVTAGRKFSNLEAGFTKFFSDFKNGYTKANKKVTDFLGEQYLIIAQKVIPGYSPYEDLIAFGPKGPPKILQIIREQVETITRIQPVKEIIKQTEVIREEVIREREVVVKEGGDTSNLEIEINALKQNISLINGDLFSIRKDVISRVNNISTGGGLPTVPAELSINRLTLAGESSVSGNSLSVESGNIAISSGGTINQSGTGQVTFSGNVDAASGLDITGNLTVSGTSAFTGRATFSNATISFNGVAYGWPSADGSTSQRLTTDGDGNLSWQTVTGENFFTDGGTFTYLSTTTQDFVLGSSAVAGASFFFDVSAKRLGINTRDGTPSTLLEIQDNDSGLNSAGSDVVLTINNASSTGAFDPYIRFQTASTTRWILGADDSASDLFRIATSSMTAAPGLSILQSSGFVGIGTTTPSGTLGVQGTSFFSGNATFYGGFTCADCITLGTETAGDYVQSITGTNGITVSGGSGESSTPSVLLGGSLTQATTVWLNSSAFNFNLDSTGDFSIRDATTTIFAVYDNGRVGLKTRDGTPSTLLEIQDNDSGLNSAGSDVVLTINNASSTAAFDPYIRFQTASTTRWILGADDSASDLFRIATSSMTAAPGLSILQSSGFVGIGTTTPSGTLGVQGTSFFSGVASFYNTSTSFNGISYGWPSADGSLNQVLTTNGARVLTWTSAASGGEWTDDAGGFLYPSETVDDIIFGASATSSAPFFFDVYRSLFKISSTGTVAFGDFNSFETVIDDMEFTAIHWTASDTSNTPTSTATSTDPTSTTAPKVGTQALRITTNGNSSIGDTVTKSFSANKNFSSYETIGFWIYATNHSTTTSQIISIQLNDSSTGILDHNISMREANRWQYEEWNLSVTTTSAYDDVSAVRFIIDNATSSPTFVVAHVRLYDNDERTSELYVDGNRNPAFAGRGGVELVA